jgi:hypothetical protein
MVFTSWNLRCFDPDAFLIYQKAFTELPHDFFFLNMIVRSHPLKTKKCKEKRSHPPASAGEGPFLLAREAQYGRALDGLLFKHHLFLVCASKLA